MSRIPLTPFLAFLSLGCTQGLMAQLTPSQMSSTTQSSSSMERMKPYEKPATPPTAPRAELPPPVQRAPEVPQHAEYLHPGILVNVNGAWEGSDHLLNLTHNIGVYVKLLKPEEVILGISENQLQKEVETIFKDAGIKPVTMAPAGKPPLPAFEIEIFVYPIERGYTTFIDGRLFESVVLERFKLDPNMAFQAITWEKQTLFIGPKDTFAEQLTKSVQELVEAFAARFQTYERLKQSATY